MAQIQAYAHALLQWNVDRLAAADLTPDVRARELAAVTVQVAAIRERLESEYRSNQSRGAKP